MIEARIYHDKSDSKASRVIHKDNFKTSVLNNLMKSSRKNKNTYKAG